MNQETRYSALAAALLTVALAGCQKQDEVPAPETAPATEAPAMDAPPPPPPMNDTPSGTTTPPGTTGDMPPTDSTMPGSAGDASTGTGTSGPR